MLLVKLNMRDCHKMTLPTITLDYLLMFRAWIKLFVEKKLSSLLAFIVIFRNPEITSTTEATLGLILRIDVYF